MHRDIIANLSSWLISPSRRPLVLRGARQVGKTWIVRELATQAGRELVEVNFERDVRFARVFAQGNAARLLSDLELMLGHRLDRRRCLLFLDEVQAAPEAFASLRWFAEEVPQLPVIAAGSLLELALGEEALRVPVGRVTYRHVEPMSFAEFLQAHGQDELLARVRGWRPGVVMADVEHEVATEWFERFAMVGGMPAVVAADADRAEARQVRALQLDLMRAYRDDFRRYVGRMDPTILDHVLHAAAAQLGEKFVHARVGEGVRLLQSNRALELLTQAHVLTLALHSHARGLPLGGDVELRNKKAMLLDVGLVHALLHTPAAAEFPRWRDLADAVRAKLSAQLAAQQLRVLATGTGAEPSLHYWQRSGGRAGEIDFLVENAQRIVPVELKAGAAGSMKSLHQFVAERGLELALRCDRNPPSLQELAVKTTAGHSVRYRILNLPGYLLWRAGELLEQVTAAG